MEGGNVARTGLLLVMVSFPLYLLWKGRLPAYLALAKGTAA